MPTRTRTSSPARARDRAHVPDPDTILAALPPEEHDRLVPLLAGGPAVVERLIGRRPHRAMLWRHARDGVHGVRLATVAVGRTLHVSPRMIAEHWCAVADARRAAEDAARRAPIRVARTKARRRPAAAEAQP